MNETIKIALADDHTVLRNGLSDLIKKFGYEVLFECSNGLELMRKIEKSNPPDIVLMDINMPQMDGFEATLWLKRNYPLVHVLALSMYDDESAILRMIRNGARGYILKESESDELKSAINNVMYKGFHYSEVVTGKLVHSIKEMDDLNNDSKQLLKLNEKEIEFLKWAATELTYKEIASKMHVSPRTIDGYRDQLFEKLNVKSRVGLALFAVKNKIVHIN